MYTYVLYMYTHNSSYTVTAICCGTVLRRATVPVSVKRKHSSGLVTCERTLVVT